MLIKRRTKCLTVVKAVTIESRMLRFVKGATGRYGVSTVIKVITSKI